MRNIKIVLLLILPLIADAQLPKKIRPIFMLDTYYSSVGGRGADVFGLKGGVELEGKWRFAAGYNRITADVVEYKRLTPDRAQQAGREEVKAQLYMRYFPLMAEYVVYSKDPWQFSVPLQLGYGRSYFQYFDAEGNKQRILERGVLVNDLGVTGQYKVLKWFGAGLGLGYRIMLIDNPNIDTDFNTPVVSIRLKFFFNEIYKSLKGLDSPPSGH